MGMAKADIEARVIEIVAEQAVLEPGDVSMDQSLADLGIDSLGLVEAIFAIEEAFDISVPFNAPLSRPSPSSCPSRRADPCDVS
jgi:acyl carrier protein